MNPPHWMSEPEVLRELDVAEWFRVCEEYEAEDHRRANGEVIEEREV